MMCLYKVLLIIKLIISIIGTIRMLYLTRKIFANTGDNLPLDASIIIITVCLTLLTKSITLPWIFIEVVGRRYENDKT